MPDISYLCVKLGTQTLNGEDDDCPINKALICPWQTDFCGMTLDNFKINDDDDEDGKFCEYPLNSIGLKKII